jgi:hypothetical protein
LVKLSGHSKRFPVSHHPTARAMALIEGLWRASEKKTAPRGAAS